MKISPRHRSTFGVDLLEAKRLGRDSVWAGGPNSLALPGRRRPSWAWTQRASSFLHRTSLARPLFGADDW